MPLPLASLPEVKPHGTLATAAPSRRNNAIPLAGLPPPTTTAAVKQHHRDSGFDDPLTDDIKSNKVQRAGATLIANRPGPPHRESR